MNNPYESLMLIDMQKYLKQHFLEHSDLGRNCLREIYDDARIYRDEDLLQICKILNVK